MNRRKFLSNLAGIFVAASAPTIFVPKLIKPAWKVPLEHPSVTLVKNSLKNTEAFGAYIVPVIRNMLDGGLDWHLIYDFNYGEDNSPSIPIYPFIA